MGYLKTEATADWTILKMWIIKKELEMKSVQNERDDWINHMDRMTDERICEQIIKYIKRTPNPREALEEIE
jgi:hypothetical protein